MADEEPDVELRALSTDATASEKHSSFKWFEDPPSVVVALVVVASAFSLPLFRYLNDYFDTTHPALTAVLGGIITFVISAPIMVWADRKYGMSSAVLLSLIVAEFNVYGAPCKEQTVAPVAISFLFFMFAYGLAEAPHLWPDGYEAHRQGGQYLIDYKAGGNRHTCKREPAH